MTISIDQLTVRANRGDTARQFALASRILEEVELCSISTIAPGAEPHINTAYFAYDCNDCCLYILTPPESGHAKNISNNPLVAVAIFSQDQVWDGPHVGLQIFGICELVSAGREVRAFDGYMDRYPELRVLSPTLEELHETLESRFYAIFIDRIKLLDEAENGPEQYVTLTIERPNMIEGE